MMELYSADASPYARKVRICIHELGLVDQVREIGAAGTPMAPGTMPVSQNPLGKIPCLTRTDGVALYDSRVITQYLNNRAGGNLYPDAPRLWETLTLEATADGIMDAALLMVYERRVRDETIVFEDWIEGQWTKVVRSLGAIEARWMSHLAGPMDAAHIGLAAALGYLDFRLDDRNWRASHANLANWFSDFSERTSFKDTSPA
jgi:glutathione S-transferase